MQNKNGRAETTAMSQPLLTPPGRVVAINTIVLTGADFFIKSTIAAISITIARKLGPGVFGAYETAFSLTCALVLYVNFGMNGAIVRSASDPRQDMNAFLGTALILKMGLAVVIYPLAILMAATFGYSTLILRLVGIMSIFSAALVFELTFGAVFQAHQRMGLLAVGRVLGTLAYAGAALLILISTMSVEQLAWVRLLGVLVTVACLWVIIKKLRLAQPRLLLSSVRPLLLSALPFGLVQIITTWHFKIDILLVAALTDARQAGIFSASSRTLGLLLLLPMAFSYALTPAAFQAGRKAEQKLVSLYQHSVFVSMVLGMPVTAGIFFIAKPFIRFVFGSEYAPMLLPLIPLSWCLPCIMLSLVTMNTLWGAGRMYTVPLFFGIGLIANIAVDLLLIPNNGAWGAAIGALVGQLVTAIAALIFVRLTFARIGIASLLWAPILSSAVMLAALYGIRELLHDLPGIVPMEVALGAAIYVLVLHALGKATGLYHRDFWPQLRWLK
jgi:O-antigen/teichoic acid export membrane protein